MAVDDRHDFHAFSALCGSDIRAAKRARCSIFKLASMPLTASEVEPTTRDIDWHGIFPESNKKMAAREQDGHRVEIQPT
jgi:hypothetical protein